MMTSLRKKILLYFLAFILIPFASIGQNTLIIPDTINGTKIDLILQNGTHSFFPGQFTQTMGANGSILGPTLLLNKDDFIKFSVKNDLGDSTTLHWHGMHVSSENDGGPHTVIPPGDTWTPEFKVMDNASTYWYHPHLHKKTNEHVSKGIAGLIIVRDSAERSINIPRAYGIDDFPLIIQTKSFDSTSQILFDSNADSMAMVNATINPVLDVPAQVVRFRVLNGSSQRSFNIGFSNNLEFYQIATDGGLMEEPNKTTRLPLAPGERCEILLNLDTLYGQTFELVSYASGLSNGTYGATYPGMSSMMILDNYYPNPLNGSDFRLLTLNVITSTINPVTTIPNTLIEFDPWKEVDADEIRNLSFSPNLPGPNQLNGEFLINNRSFQMDYIDYYVPLNNIEVWEIFNQSGMAHPFHIHDIQFHILSRNNLDPPAHELGRKDVIMVQPRENIRFITKFEDFANESVPYMFHCHMLTHEDGGMMGQFIVSDTLTGVRELKGNGVNLYPNPNNGSFEIEIGEKDGLISIYNASGSLIHSQLIYRSKRLELDIDPGIYLLMLTNNQERRSVKFLVH